MTTEGLIEKLVARAQPVRRAMPAPVALALWLALGAAGIALVNASLFPMRADLYAAITTARFLATVVTLFLLTTFSALDALSSARPGRGRVPALVLGSRLSLGAFFLSLAMPPWDAVSWRAGLDVAGVQCTNILLMLSAVPAVLLVLAVRRLAPVNPGVSARLVGLAVGALGALGLTLDCPAIDAVHLVVWHGLPVLLLGFVSEKTAARLFRW